MRPQMVTAFGGGTIYVIVHALSTEFNTTKPELLSAVSWGKLAWHNPSCVAAAVVGWLVALPLGAHPLDAEHIGSPALSYHNVPLFTVLDCLNNGILVAWAVSKLSVDKKIPRPLWFPAVFSYCAGGGTIRDLIFKGFGCAVVLLSLPSLALSLIHAAGALLG